MSRWVEKRGGWEEGKSKARGSPRPRFLSPALPLPSFFFDWCLLTGASEEERAERGVSFSEVHFRMANHV